MILFDSFWIFTEKMVRYIFDENMFFFVWFLFILCAYVSRYLILKSAMDCDLSQAPPIAMFMYS